MSNTVRTPARRSPRAWFAWLGLLPAAIALAADLPDPTRPPVTQRPTASGGPVPVAVPTVPLLQSILIGDGRKSSAVINGRVVELGASVDELRLTQLTGASATLTGPRGNTVLSLTPDAAKQVTNAASAAGSTPAGARKSVKATPPLRVAEQK